MSGSVELPPSLSYRRRPELFSPHTAAILSLSLFSSPFRLRQRNVTTLHRHPRPSSVPPVLIAHALRRFLLFSFSFRECRSRLSFYFVPGSIYVFIFLVRVRVCVCRGSASALFVSSASSLHLDVCRMPLSSMKRTTRAIRRRNERMRRRKTNKGKPLACCFLCRFSFLFFCMFVFYGSHSVVVSVLLPPLRTSPLPPPSVTFTHVFSYRYIGMPLPDVLHV